MALAISACTNTTEVQRRYVDLRDECRGQAEASVSQFGGPEQMGGTKQFNSALATIFSQCMSAHGWTVASAQPAPPATGTGVGVTPGPDASARRAPQPSVAETATRPAPMLQPNMAPAYVPMNTQNVQPAPVPVPYAPQQQEIRKRPKENPPVVRQ